MKFKLIMLSSLLLIGCVKQPEQPHAKVVAVYSEKYEIVHVDQPKHFWVNLKHVETGHIFTNTARSKHCNNWRNYPVGSVIMVNTFHYDNNTFAVDGDFANQVICR